MIQPAMRSRQTRRAGVTFVELLVAVTLLAMVGAAMAAAFGAGIRVWEAARGEGAATPLVLGLEQMQRDVMNLTAIGGAPFEGERESMVVPVLLRTPEGGPERPGRVRYQFNPGQRQLTRTAWLQPGPEPAEGAAEVLISEVAETSLSFYDAAPGGKAAGTWRDQWSGRTNAPAGVRVVVRVAHGGTTIEQRRTFVRPGG